MPSGDIKSPVVNVVWTETIIGPTGKPGAWQVQLHFGPWVFVELRGFQEEDHAKEHALEIAGRAIEQIAQDPHGFLGHVMRMNGKAAS